MLDKPWNDMWESCLVQRHLEGERGYEWEQIAYRTDVITQGFIYPQLRATTPDTRKIDHLVKDTRLIVRGIAVREMRNYTPCEAPIMMWDHLSDIARDTLSEYPSKDQVERLLEHCYEVFEKARKGHWKKTKEWCNDPNAKPEQEVLFTIWELETLLKEWGLNDMHPLHFYPIKHPRFRPYLIHNITVTRAQQRSVLPLF